MGFIKDLDFRRIILKYENEPSMKAFQEVMIHSCVEVAVRETKRQCRILRISAEHNKSVGITDDISLLNWILRFAMQFLNRMRTGRRWREPSRNLCWSSGSNKSNSTRCQEWNCARQKSDKSDLE